MRRYFDSHKRWPLHSRGGMNTDCATAFGNGFLFSKSNDPFAWLTSWCEVKSRALAPKTALPSATTIPSTCSSANMCSQRLLQCSYQPPIAIDVTEHNMKQALTHSADLHRFSAACGEACIRHASRQATYSGNRHFDACTFYRGTCAGGCTLECRTYLVRGKLRVSSVYHLGPCTHDNDACCCGAASDVSMSAMG